MIDPSPTCPIIEERDPPYLNIPKRDPSVPKRKFSPPYQKDIEAVNKYKIFIGIKSMPTHLEARRAIRESWLRYITDPSNSALPSDLKKSVTYRFFLGYPKEPGCRPPRTGKLCNTSLSFESIQAELIREEESFNDVIRLPILDHYWGLSEKLTQTLVWSYQSVNFDYFIGTDDDPYVQLDKIVLEILKSTPDRLYWGNLHKGVSSLDGKYIYHHGDYPPYMNGVLYGLSRDLVGFVAHNADGLKQLLLDDAALGYWLSPMFVNKVDYKDRYRLTPDPENFNCSILVEHNPREELRTIYDALQEGLICRDRKIT